MVDKSVPLHFIRKYNVFWIPVDDRVVLQLFWEHLIPFLAGEMLWNKP